MKSDWSIDIYPEDLKRLINLRLREESLIDTIHRIFTVVDSQVNKGDIK